METRLICCELKVILEKIGLLGVSVVKNPPAEARDMGSIDPWVRNIPRRRK